MTYEDYMPVLEPIIDSVVYKFRNAKTEREDLRQEAHLVLFRCLDKLQAAPGDGYKPLARAIVTNRFKEIIREEHRRGQWSQCELSDAVLSRDCTDVTVSFDDEYFARERARYREYYRKNRERILARIHARRAANMDREREHARQYYQERRDEIGERCRKYYQEHKEEQKAAQIERYHSMDEEQKAKRREYSRKYYEAHKEEIKERELKKYYERKAAGQKGYTEDWLERHPDYMREWRENNPEKQRAYSRKYYDTHREEIKTRNKERWNRMSEAEKERRRAQDRERYRKKKEERETA